jgi:PAS domain S-box-containing protein
LLLEAISTAVLVIDDAGRVALSNAHADRLLAYGREELAGEPVERIIPELRAGSERLALRKDGRAVPVDIALRSLDLNGRQFLVASVVDRTGVTRAYEAQHTLAAIVESADDAIVTKDLDGIIRTWNAGAERLLGYTADEIVGEPITRLIPADRWDEEARIIERIRRGERVAHLETLRRAKDGRLIDVSLTVSPIRTESGQIVGASKIMRDISERKSAEQLHLRHAAVEQRAAVLEEVAAELESFSYSVSHDLQAPVRAVVGFTRALAEKHGAALDDEGRRLLALVHDEGVRMGALIDDLLAFARLARTPMRTEPVDMVLVVRDVCAEALRRGETGQATIEVGTLPAVCGDRALLRAVWSNLIANALKFSSRRERPQIAITGEVTDAGATYHVTDNGVGFDMRYAGKLFGVFARLHGEDEFPGTGIGLAIVRRIVQRHGGTVAGLSLPGAGATFSFVLPVAPDA